jgi:hypothetical protein
MQRSLPLLIALAGITLAQGGCSGDDDPAEPEQPSSVDSALSLPADTRPNAAPEYARIHAAMGPGFFDPLVNVSTRTPPDASESKFLAGQQDLIRQIIAASRIERCDFGVERTQGLNIPMPHLTAVRHCAQLLQYDAHRMIGSLTGAAEATERLAALFRVARHAGSDPMIIPRLVSMACLSIGEQSLSMWNDRIRDKKQRAMLLAELQAVRASGLFEMREVLARELAATRQTIESGQAYEVVGGPAVDVPPDERAAVIAEIEGVFAEVDRVWQATDAEQQIKRLIESVRNPRARVFVAGLDLFRRQCGKSERELASAISRLER